MRYLLLLALLGCGSSETPGDGGTDATSDHVAKDSALGFDVTSDSIFPNDAAPPPPTCPQSAPTAGTSCTGVGLCEYGSSFWPECDVLRQCDGATWSVVDKSSECPMPMDAGACPVTDAGLSGTCSNLGWCEYPTQECFCVTTCGGPPMPTGNDSWACVSQSQGDCPWPRPRFGAPCATEGKSCAYTICCGGAAMLCTNGQWTGKVDTFGCP